MRVEYYRDLTLLAANRGKLIWVFRLGTEPNIAVEHG
jgi:hypothetical protein